MPTLTDDQAWDLVVEAEPVVRHYARWAHNTSRHSSLSQSMSLDDFIQEGNLIAFEVAKHWRPDRNATYQTYLTHRLRWGMFDLVHPLRRQKHNVVTTICSLDLFMSDDIEEMSFADGILDENSDFEDELVTQLAYDELMRDLPIRTAYVFQERLNGRMLQSIGDDLGVSESRVSQICANLKEPVKEALTA